MAMLAGILQGSMRQVCRASIPCHRVLSRPVPSNWKAGKLPWIYFRTANGSTQVSRTTLKQLREKMAKKLNASPVQERSRLSKIVDGCTAGLSLVGIGTLIYVDICWTFPDISEWSDVAKQRMRDTFMYFGGGMLFTAASAVTIARSAALTRLFGGAGWMSLLATVAVAFTSGYVCHALPYREGLGTKQLVWMFHNTILGMLIAPLSALGGPVMLHVAFCGTGIVWGLASQAMCRPNETIFVLCPLAMILSLCFTSSVGTWFLPPSPYTGLWSVIVSSTMRTGLVLFGGFLMYETTKIAARARIYPEDGVKPYDPINNSIRIYISAINVMYNIAMILIQEDSRWR